MQRVLIIGGYGYFGGFIAQRLARHPDIQLIIAGRSQEKAQAFIETLQAVNPAEAFALDIHSDFAAHLAIAKPDIVIHTCGPFQDQGYDVAKACIQQGCHYIDIADARGFVSGIAQLDDAAKAANICVISGASSVPGLTSAIIDHYLPEFSRLEEIDYAIATAQQTNRGLGTTSAVLSYVGKPFQTLINGVMQTIYGWQNLHFKRFPKLGWRGLANCDIADLAIFPARYPSLKTIRFYAGLEVPLAHIGLWLLSWAVRFKIISSLKPLAPWLLGISRIFDLVGSDRSGFYMRLQGKDTAGQAKSITCWLLAFNGQGPYIPCMPAILLAEKIARGDMLSADAMPCMGIITLNEYLAALQEFTIEWQVT